MAGKYDDLLADLPPAPSTGGRYDDILAGIDDAPSPLEGALGRIRAANPVAAEKVMRGLVATPEGRQKLAPFLPAIAGTAGTALAPGLGTAAFGGVGEILRQMIEVEGGARPSATRAGLEAAGGTLLAGIPESKPVINALKGTAVGAGRRALGFTKRFLSKSPRQLAEANRVAETMLEEGVIRPFSGTGATLERALGAGKNAGRVIGSTIDELDESGRMAFRPADLSDEIERQIGPKFGGGKKAVFSETKKSKYPLFGEVEAPSGAYGKTRRIVNEAKDTVKAHGGVGYASPEEIGFKSAQKMKEKLADIGRFVPGTVDERQKVFQRATGITRKALDSAVKREAGPATAAKYGRAKRVYGDSERAIAGLTNRLSSEEGNLQLGLLDTILAAGNLASGNVGQAAATIGLKKAFDRVGSGTISALANALATSGLSRSAANSVLQTILASIESGTAE